MLYELPILLPVIACLKMPSGRIFELKQGRYHGGPSWSNFKLICWEVFHDGKVVGRLYDGYSYGWGNVHANLSPVRGLAIDFDMWDHNIHDLGPSDFESTFNLLCFRADYILTARQRNPR